MAGAMIFSNQGVSQSFDGSGQIPPLPKAEFKAAKASDLINVIYQALPLMPTKEVLLPKEVQIKFNSPGQTDGVLSKFICDRIGVAKKEIIFSAGVITDKDIAGLLVSQKLQGRIVTGIITESPPGIKNYTAPSYFLVNNLAIFFDSSKIINGNNFIIIDREEVILLSCTMTPSMMNGSNSSAISIKDPGVVVAYYNAWIDQLRASTVPKVTQAILNTIIGKAPKQQLPPSKPDEEVMQTMPETKGTPAASQPPIQPKQEALEP